MIHDGCGPANYTAWQNNFCLSFSRAHRSAQWTPFFALIVEIILVRKSRKTLRSRPPLSLFRSPSFSSISFHPFLSAAATRTNTHNDTSFCGDFFSSCYSSFIGTNITDVGYKSGGNDFGQEC